MTISVTNIVAGPFASTGVAQSLAFGFKAFNEDELEVFVELVDGAQVVIDDSEYGVTLNENLDGSRAEGGSVSITYPVGSNLYVRAKPGDSQDQIWSNQGSRLSNLNEALDRVTLQLLRNQYDLQRAVVEAGSLIGLLGKVDKSALLSGAGASLMGFLQSGTGAATELVQATLRRLVVMPEQFAGTDQEKVQAAFNSAGDLPGQNVARIVRLSRFYATTATIDVPTYVTVEGIGAGRCGLRPTMAAGPALRANAANNSSSFRTEWKDFTIDGVNATGSAYALELGTQKITMFSRLGFINFDTSQHAVQCLLGMQTTIFDQCWWYNNRLHQRIGVPYVGVSFPTTILHRGCIYEEGLATGAECVLVEDSNGITWDDKCVLQGNLQPVVFRVKSSANQQTSANHQWINTYIEGNGIGQANAYTWWLEGDSVADRLSGCVIMRSDIHGAEPSGAHIYAKNTDLLQVKDNQVNPSDDWLVDGGGNIRYDIDARYVGECDLQTDEYNRTVVAWRDNNDVRYVSGIGGPTIAKNATGVYRINFARAFKSGVVHVQFNAVDAGAEPMITSAYPLDADTIEVHTFLRNTPDAVVPTPNTSGTVIPIPDLVAANLDVGYLTVQGPVVAAG